MTYNEEDELLYDGLNLYELSILTLSNNAEVEAHDMGQYGSDGGNRIVLTTKEMYLWGIIMTELVLSEPELDERDIIYLLSRALGSRSLGLKEFYSFTPRLGGNISNNYINYIYQSFLKEADLYFSNVSLQVTNINAKLKETLESLEEKGLIIDPVFTTILGVSVAVVGFIPFGFTMKTVKGKSFYLKLVSAFWTYEQTTNHDKDKTIQMHFKLWKIITAVKSALADETDQVMKKNDDLDRFDSIRS